uniref:NELL2-interacting cell ontogeny regulator 1 n=1 Tax=Chrysemys picta bellii TaxID=8478 RepID=A0A8C3IPH7_CHRPI
MLHHSNNLFQGRLKRSSAHARRCFFLFCWQFAAAMSKRPSQRQEKSGRPCVDCHAFEFMQRALQDLKKTAYNLDTRTETLLLQVEKRTLCDCVTADTLN